MARRLGGQQALTAGEPRQLLFEPGHLRGGQRAGQFGPVATRYRAGDGPAELDPAVGSATFTGLTLSDNAEDIRNTTSTFTIIRN